jgi:DNA polymerase
MQESFLFDPTPIDSNETLEEINKEMLERTVLIPQLAERVFIFGEGVKNARLVLVGESPGPPDAESGKPFMGPTGDLLERILNAIGLKRSDCYLTNVVKYISTGDELTNEILNFFTPFLHRELAVVKPHVIVTLGNTPTKALLNSRKPISQMRGVWQDYRGMKLMPTFNPAYLLRDPTKKREVWEDMKLVRTELMNLAS